MTLRRDFLSMTAGAVAARTVLPMAAQAAEADLAAVDPDQFPRLSGYSAARAALLDVQAGLPTCIFHEWLEGGLRMAVRAFPGDGTFRDITLKLAMVEAAAARAEEVGNTTMPLPKSDAELLALAAEAEACEAKIYRYDRGLEPLTEDEVPAVLHRSSVIETRLMAMRPATPEGLQAKARVVRAVMQNLVVNELGKTMEQMGKFAELMAWSLVNDVLAMGAA